MLSSLKNHPFSVEAFFESSLVLTFAFQKEKLEGLIPACLTLDTFDNKWAFVAVAVVKTKNLRPKGFPTMLGNNFTLIGYRIFVNYHTNAGKRLRGLYILKSETDNKLMKILGSIFTNYQYTTTDISYTQQNKKVSIRSPKSDLHIEVVSNDVEILLPANSPFDNWTEARKFSGPLPFTFSFNRDTKEVLIIEGVRQNWVPIPVTVTDYNIPFFKEDRMIEGVLANAFVINNISYYWKKGRVEYWTT